MKDINKKAKTNPFGDIRPMVKRNLKIGLVLRPEFIKLKIELGWTSKMTPEDYESWKKHKACEITQGVRRLLDDYNIPMYQLPFINWLFEASDEEVEKLKKHTKKPAGEPPEAYLLLYAPAYDLFDFRDKSWVQETGYRVAATTLEKGQYWRIWGDIRGVPEKVWDHIMKSSGDFVIRGNLEVFDIESWRRIGKLLSRLKKHSSAGDKFKFIPGAQKGWVKPKKHVMDNLTWVDIQNIVAGDPAEYNHYCHKYTKDQVKRWEDSYKKAHSKPTPPGQIMGEIQKKAIKNFKAHVKLPKIR